MNLAKILITASLFSAMGTASAETNFVEANHFTCTSSSKRKITFSTTSVLGTPNFSIDGRNSGAELTNPEIKQTPMGLMVTAFDQLIMDATINYTLVIPNTHIGTSNREAISGFLIQSTTGSLMPTPRPGAVQYNNLETVSCNAIHAFF